MWSSGHQRHQMCVRRLAPLTGLRNPGLEFCLGKMQVHKFPPDALADLGWLSLLSPISFSTEL